MSLASENLSLYGRLKKATLGPLGVTGSLLGFAVGVWEAGLLHSVPRYPTLVAPEAGWTIFFLAPLMNLLLYGLLGVIAEGVLSFAKALRSSGRVVFQCGMLGLACAHLGWMLTLVHMWVGNLNAVDDLLPPLTWFAGGFLVSLLLSRVFWRHVVALFSVEARWPLRAAAWSVAGAIALLTSGLVGIKYIPGDSDAALATGPPVRSSNPNIVIITLDTVRADHLSCYGYARPTTPNLDRLASRGILFDNAISPCSWTLPSHASIFTALLPHQHGANGGMPEPTGVWNLAEVLQKEGYETAGFSSNTMFGQAAWGLGQGFSQYADYRSTVRYNLALTLVGRALIQPLFERLDRFDLFCRRNAQEVNNEVFRWFRRRSSRPYFLFINYFDAHDTYIPPRPYDRRFGELPDDLARRVCFGHGLALKKPLTEAENQKVVAAYDNGLAYLDEQVGKLMEVLAHSPDWANTVVIVTSDHGEAFGEHGIYGHGWFLYRELIHVPLLISGPGVPAGLRLEHVVRIREIFPTALDLTLGKQRSFPRTSLKRYWMPAFTPDEFDDAAVSELSPGFPNSGTPPMMSLTTSQWQYIRDSNGQRELFEWKSDPTEKVNLAALPEHAKTISSLEERLRIVITESRRPWRGPEYLMALDHPGYSFLRDLAFHPTPSQPPPTRWSVGTSQVALGPDPTGVGSRPFPSDEDMLDSIPYR